MCQPRYTTVSPKYCEILVRLFCGENNIFIALALPLLDANVTACLQFWYVRLSMVAELPACRYLSVQDSELPAYHYLPLKKAELHACSGCGITCLSKMRNYLPIWTAKLSACLDAFRWRVFFSCLSRMRNYQPVWDSELPTSVGCGIACCIECRITSSAFPGFVSDCPSVCLLVCYGCVITCLSGMRHYLPAYDAEFPACPGCVITSLPRMQNYQPVQDAELPACPVCRITSLSKISNYHPVQDA